MHVFGLPDAMTILSAYAQGLFPMDSPEDRDGPLPFYRADPRAVLEVDAEGIARTRRAVRRSLARDPGWEPAVDRAFERVVAGCAAPRPQQGVWLTQRMRVMYEQLHAAGAAHSYELWAGDELAAGILGVRVGRAAMLESMFHRIPDAGNVNVIRTLERLAGQGVVLCDIQVSSPHTRRIGARDIPLADYQARLAAALS